MKRRTAAMVWVLSATLVALGPAAPAAAAADDLTLASRAAGFGPPSDDHSQAPMISANGRFAVFTSGATNLDPESSDAVWDVFVKDLTTGDITLASRATGRTGVVGDGHSGEPSISADGRYVAFRSGADNLDTESNDALSNIFVRDLVAETTTLVNRATGASGAVANAESMLPEISADGRHVAFISSSTNLDPDSTAPVFNVFYRDLVADTTILVSRATGATGAAADQICAFVSISGDGSRIAFQSNATNLDTESLDPLMDVFVRDLNAQTTTLVSRADGPAGAVNDRNAAVPSISADGRFVAFQSDATNLDGESDDSAEDVFVRDLTMHTTTLVSRASGATGQVGNGASLIPTISADGSFVAFSSRATNLSGDPDAVMDVFVRDLVAQETTHVSRAAGASGAFGDGESIDQSISADGRFVAFQSAANNLDEHSTDGKNDVFVRDVLGPRPPVELSIADLSAKEGKAGTRPFGLVVTLDGTPGRTVTVDFATRDGTAVASKGDYIPTNGSLTFAIGEKRKVVAVQVRGDKAKEKREYFEVQLFNANGAPIADAVARGTIRNDDR